MKAEIDAEGVLTIQPETEEELEELRDWTVRNIKIDGGQYQYANNGGLEIFYRLPGMKSEVKV